VLPLFRLETAVSAHKCIHFLP